jgi:UPF0755 protein
MRRTIVILFFGVLFLTALVAAGSMYNRIWRSNVKLSSEREMDLYIPTGSGFEDVLQLLAEHKVLRDTSSFRWLAIQKNYPNHVYPGKYRIHNGLNNNQLVGLLRSGKQEPVQLVFNNIRTPQKLAGVVAAQIEADSLGILSIFSDDALLADHQLSRETVYGVFIPNTYEIYWNTSPSQFLERMVREYRIFWNEKRLARARNIGLSPMEVMTLASIVDEETLKTEEEARIAGLYMNRLKQGMRLQADPTVKFAAGDMTITRVLKQHLAIESPYNTYRHGGLPPGPIVIPSVSAIDAVLHYERHPYLYMCAREDFSGFHNFANTLSQHNKNARSYQNALNRRKIFN